MPGKRPFEIITLSPTLDLISRCTQ